MYSRILSIQKNVFCLEFKRLSGFHCHILLIWIILHLSSNCPCQNQHEEQWEKSWMFEFGQLMTNLSIYELDVSGEIANYILTLILMNRYIRNWPIAMLGIQLSWRKCMWWKLKEFLRITQMTSIRSTHLSTWKYFGYRLCGKAIYEKRFFVWHLVLYIPFDRCELKWRRHRYTIGWCLAKMRLYRKSVCSWFSMIVRTWLNPMHFEYVKHVQKPNTTTTLFPLPCDNKMWFWCYGCEYIFSMSFILGISVKLQAFSMIAVWFSKSCLSIYECELCACA